tara:strand:+ start:2202 stop:2414 length:213 start_codon:yes stop_codon:yes gene_type:complete
MPVSEHAAAFIDNARKRAAKLLKKQKWRGDLTYQGIPRSAKDAGRIRIRIRRRRRRGKLRWDSCVVAPHR